MAMMTTSGSTVLGERDGFDAVAGFTEHGEPGDGQHLLDLGPSDLVLADDYYSWIPSHRLCLSVCSLRVVVW